MRLTYSEHLNAGYIQFGLAYAAVFSVSSWSIDVC